MNDPTTDALHRVMARAQRLGVLGARQGIDEHLAPGEVLVRAVQEYGVAIGSVIDLGSGAGLPGLQVAAAWPEARVLLIERRQRRADLLVAAVRELGWSDRVEVSSDDVAQVARSALRGTADLVTARSFAPPPVTVELGVPLVRPGGVMAVVDAADSAERWPDRPDWGALGIEALVRVGTSAVPIVLLTRSEAALEEWPRAAAARRRTPVF